MNRSLQAYAKPSCRSRPSGDIEKPEELIERALEGDARALRVLIFITHNAGYAAAVDDMGPTDEQILEAFNRGRVEDSEIDRENAVEISGGDISQLDIENGVEG